MSGDTLMGIITIVSVCLNALAAIFAPIIGRKLAKRGEDLDKADAALNQVAAGLRVVEKAVEENKDLLARTGAGNTIANTIRTYGPAAKELVDTARQIAAEVRRAGDPGVDDDVAARAK